MAKNPYKAILTPTEAERAIYIDFEGRKGEPPVLLGSLYFEGRKVSDPDRLVFRHDVLDPALHAVIDGDKIEGLHHYQCLARTLPQAVHDLIRRAKNQRRPIVAWSEHEITTIEASGVSSYLQKQMRRWFRNGLATARRWRRECHADWTLERDAAGRANRLAAYMDRVGYDVPAEFRGGRVGETIKATRAALTVGTTWEDLTELRRQRWTELLMHNMHDCNGMRIVVQQAAEDLAAVT